MKILFLLALLFATCHGAVELIREFKEQKKFFTSNRAAVIAFFENESAAKPYLSVLNQASDQGKKHGAIGVVYCEGKSKTLCKYEFPEGSNTLIKHFIQGKPTSSDFDLSRRKITVPSLVNYLRSPDGDIPWEEVSKSKDIIHIHDMDEFERLSKSKKPLVLFFHTPGCQRCVPMKQPFEVAAMQLKGKVNFAAANMDTPDLSDFYTIQPDLKGFPAVYYYHQSMTPIANFIGARDVDQILEFAKEPANFATNEEKKRQEKELAEPKWQNEPNSQVSHLNATSFEAHIAAHPEVLVMVWAPWCGHCKNAKPHYSVAASKLNQQGKQGFISAIDSTDGANMMYMEKWKHLIPGYPTFMYFKNGNYQFNFEGGREENDFISFAENPVRPTPPPPPEMWADVSGPNVLHLDEESFAKTLKKKKHALVMFYTNWCGHCKQLKPKFVEAANHLAEQKGVALVAVECDANKKLSNEFGITGFPTLKYFSKGKYVDDYSGERTASAIEAFFQEKLNGDSSKEL